MNEAEIYRAQGFGHRLAPGRCSALVVVDFVNGFVDPDVFGGGNSLDAAKRFVPALDLWRNTNLPVVFTRIVYADDGSDTGIWCEKVPSLKGLTEDATASQVVDFLAPRDGETVIRKTQASAFFGTELASLLADRGIDSVVVAGCTTSGCVRATIVDAISHNFRPFVLSDCVGDRSVAAHDANLFDMEQKYADLLAVSDLDRILEAAVSN
ncbi:isochorismatase family protein [Oricola nitratireducens]|uniref:isochorismatase family protein n=1 Tax=Oricola nitratireducens TaxID=2775868 RepID=UPI001868D8CB|nr:isochorismatase family protein [Oricola nitratireducens]